MKLQLSWVICVPLLLRTLNALAISMRAAVPELGSTAPNTHASRWLPRITVRSVCVCVYVYICGAYVWYMCMCGMCIYGVCVCVCVWGGGGGGGGGGKGGRGRISHYTSSNN